LSEPGEQESGYPPRVVVYSTDGENLGDVWETDVVTADGTKHETYVISDGTRVVYAPRNYRNLGYEGNGGSVW
jgi:hypothetical protein